MTTHDERLANLQRQVDTPDARHAGEQRATTPDLMRYLADSTDWLAHRPDGEAEAAFDELEAMADLVLDTVDVRTPGEYAGPCDHCSLDMYARPGAKIVQCRLCGVDYERGPRRKKLLEQASNRLVTAAEASKSLALIGIDLPAERIRSWARPDRQLIVRVGRDRATGDPQYRMKDILAQHDKPRPTIRKPKGA